MPGASILDQLQGFLELPHGRIAVRRKPDSAAAPGAESSTRKAASSDMLGVLSDPAAAARFGQVYLAGHPAEADPETGTMRVTDIPVAH